MTVKRTISLLLALLFALSLASCGADRGEPSDTTGTEKPRGAQDIIEELAVYYGTYGEEADSKTNELLEELRAIDGVTADKWAKIIGLWKEVNGDVALNYDVLPDGLDDTDALCLVALGFQLNEDGTMKDELIERLKVVLASAEKYPNAYVVCTGGGTAKNDESATEAGKMAEWLVENGIKKDRVIVEDKSITTAQNAIYTYEILKEKYPSVSKIAIISSDYHIATGALLFGAEATLIADRAGEEKYEIVSNAAYKAPNGTLSTMFQAGALIELSGDVETAFDIYYEEYDIHDLPPLGD